MSGVSASFIHKVVQILARIEVGDELVLMEATKGHKFVSYTMRIVWPSAKIPSAAVFHALGRHSARHIGGHESAKKLLHQTALSAINVAHSGTYDRNCCLKWRSSRSSADSMT